MAGIENIQLFRCVLAVVHQVAERNGNLLGGGVGAKTDVGGIDAFRLHQPVAELARVLDSPLQARNQAAALNRSVVLVCKNNRSYCHGDLRCEIA